MSRPLRSYDLVAGTYEASSRLFSAGKIPASKRAQLPFVRPGDAVLYLGAGAGEDAIGACEQGAQVTCVDLSAGMIARLRRKLEKKGLEAELLVADAFELDRPGAYDAVAANYFLNVFRPDDMRRMLRHAAGMIKPGGLFLVADVAHPRGNAASRAFNGLYSGAAMAAFWSLGLVPWHENYNYAAELTAEGFAVERNPTFRFAKVGPVVFETIVARKPAAGDRKPAAGDRKPAAGDRTAAEGTDSAARPQDLPAPASA